MLRRPQVASWTKRSLQPLHMKLLLCIKKENWDEQVKELYLGLFAPQGIARTNKGNWRWALGLSLVIVLMVLVAHTNGQEQLIATSDSLTVEDNDHH